MLKTVRFGPEVIEYFRERISWGKQLSKYLLDLPLEQGDVSTFLPDTVSDERIYNFGPGGITDRSIIPEYVDFISRYLRESATRYAIFEDALIQFGVPPNANPSKRFFILGY